MHKKDSGASGTRDHGDVEAFEAMSDLRGDRFFRLVESGTDSTEHCPQTLIDTTPSKMRDTRPSTAIQSSTTVTNFTADQSTVTQSSTVTHRMTQPSNMQRYSENPGKHYPCSNIRTPGFVGWNCGNKGSLQVRLDLQNLQRIFPPNRFYVHRSYRSTECKNVLEKNRVL